MLTCLLFTCIRQWQMFALVNKWNSQWVIRLDIRTKNIKHISLRRINKSIHLLNYVQLLLFILIYNYFYITIIFI